MWAEIKKEKNALPPASATEGCSARGEELHNVTKVAFSDRNRQKHSAHLEM